MTKRAGQRIGEHKDQRPRQGKPSQTGQGRPSPGAILGHAEHHHASDKTCKPDKGREKQHRCQEQPP